MEGKHTSREADQQGSRPAGKQTSREADQRTVGETLREAKCLSRIEGAKERKNNHQCADHKGDRRYHQKVWK